MKILATNNSAIALFLFMFMMIVQHHGASAWLSSLPQRSHHRVRDYFLEDEIRMPIGTHKTKFLVVPRWTNSVSLFATAQDDQIQNKECNTMISDSQFSPPSSSSLLMKTLLDRFCGDFDNYRQVVQDRKMGLLPREGGGHEHIHGVFVPVTKHARLAAFYFDGNPNAIFRFRYYHFVPYASSSRESTEFVDTYLYTLSTDLHATLCRAPPEEWTRLFREYLRQASNQWKVDSTVFLEDEEYLFDDLTQVAAQCGAIQNLPQCEVRWSWEPDPIQHSYINDVRRPPVAPQSFNKKHSETPKDYKDDDGIHAVMVHGEATVASTSQTSPGRRILIRDQLSLYEDLFFIHDRGWDPDTMEYIYGNQRGIPYLLERVTRRHANGTLILTDADLAWTLGTTHRTDKEYQKNMEQIGGSSLSK